jgi:subtilisin family serine protease
MFAAAVLGCTLLAQVPDGTPNGSIVPDHFVVLFSKRSFDLEAYRGAIYGKRPAAEVERIVDDMIGATGRDQADFVRAVVSAGGTVRHQYWLINGAAVRLANGEAFLRNLPNVASVTPDRVWQPWLDVATNALHHAGDLANQRSIGGVAVKGNGQTVAILDTGIDANHAGAGRPHAAFYPDGNTQNNGGGLNGSFIRGQFDASGTWGTEDRNGHGTFVAGCACANRWLPSNAQSDYGFAPSAGIYNINVSSFANGGALGSDITAGWQNVATRRVALNISVANNSYSGSPLLTDPTQIALDALAANSNVLIVVAAGNTGANTAQSQSAYNGLSVGSLDKGSLAVSSFSCTGPLNGTQRTYPDLTAVGNNVHSLQPDNEIAVATNSGTSFAAPMVAGVAALVRQADTTLTALETKALLLNTTTDFPGRNQYGLGSLRADQAVDAALARRVVTTRVTSAAPRQHLRVTTVNTIESVTACWFRTAAGAHENIELEIYQSNGGLVATDLNPQNSYGKVTFQPNGPGSFRAVVYLAVPGTNKNYEVAVAGGVEVMALPVIGSFNPPTIAVHQPPDVVVTGTDLDFARTVTIGGQPVTSFTVLSPTQLRFRPPASLAIGTHNVVITTEVGASLPTPIEATGTHPALLTGPSIILRGTTGSFIVYGERNWFSLLFLSTSNFPSSIPGVVDFEIGNSFLSLWQILSLSHDAQGIGRFQIPIHATFPRWAHYFELITVDPLNLTLPLETSNAHQWNAQ